MPDLRLLRLARRALVASLTALLFAIPGNVSAQSESMFFGKMAVTFPEPTEVGNWEGTWYYASRDQRMAMWMRDNDGQPTFILRVMGRAGSLESFTTNDEGRGEYDHVGKHGEFAYTLDRRDANTLSGRWTWVVQDEGGGTKENADFTIYRSGDGRQLVWKVQNMVREAWGNKHAPTGSNELVWTFMKASRRQVLWGELPF
jgi:hypothetical protein